MSKTTHQPATTLQLTKQLTHDEAATVLAALRYWQESLQVWGITDKSSRRRVTQTVNERLEHFEHFSETPALTLREIDALCEAINLQPAAAPAPVVEAYMYDGEEGNYTLFTQDIDGRRVDLYAISAADEAREVCARLNCAVAELLQPDEAAEIDPATAPRCPICPDCNANLGTAASLKRCPECELAFTIAE